MKENEMLSIEKLFKFETANSMYRNFNNLLPSVFGHIFDHSILKNNTRKLGMVQMFFQNTAD